MVKLVREAGGASPLLDSPDGAGNQIALEHLKRLYRRTGLLRAIHVPVHVQGVVALLLRGGIRMRAREDVRHLTLTPSRRLSRHYCWEVAERHRTSGFAPSTPTGVPSVRAKAD